MQRTIFLAFYIRVAINFNLELGPESRYHLAETCIYAFVYLFIYLLIQLLLLVQLEVRNCHSATVTFEMWTNKRMLRLS